MQADDFIAHPHVEKEGVLQRFYHSIHLVKKLRNLQLSIRGEELLLSYWLYLFVLTTSQGHGLRSHVLPHPALTSQQRSQAKRKYLPLHIPSPANEKALFRCQ